ncbi:TIGR02221 family CRISPR-associated protein [Methanotorris igneus]|uniref:TIGR02221 family CRISPR-associated protein n=1 Tax=Methanotorris igneus TaxID=2189 RepID=UPI002ADE5EE7|nr:TIGR02221 family CRISPR-associated protein [Methanotorris igneus]
MKLLTFLGTTKYSEVVYTHEGKEVKTRYIQKVLSEIFKPDEVVIFVTNEAYKEHGDSIKKELGNVSFVQIEIPKSQEDLWDLFEKIVESVNDNDEIIFDITHAFRHIPFMSFIVLLYLQQVKNVKIKGIYYGAFMKDYNKAPIFDLSSLLNLAEWLYEIRDLKKYGRGCFIDSNKRKVCVFSSSVIFIYHEILIIYDSTVSDMWGLKPEWGLLRALKMWGVSVPPESQPMKMGGWKVIRYDSFVCFKSSG